MPESAPHEVEGITRSIREGEDPLGDLLIVARGQEHRRSLGQILTPRAITTAMVDWVLKQDPTRVVDAGCGSGRFTLEVGRRSNASIVAIDTDPLATLLTRAGIACLSIGDRAAVQNVDYLRTQLPAHDGRTAYIGNPPYVRHHDLELEVKAWGHMVAGRFGLSVSGLAGLHAYFYLATALHARRGDIGCFVTSAEWLDVNYGSIIRHLLLDGLGGRSVQIVAPEALPFEGAATTAAVTCFEVGATPEEVTIGSVESAKKLSPLGRGRPLQRSELLRANRWRPLILSRPTKPSGYVELGEICRVHRGQVTGSNAAWVVAADGTSCVPERFLIPTVTRARDLLESGARLSTVDELRRVIDLPPSLDELTSEERAQVDAFLEILREAGTANGYVARHRRAWWSVGLRKPAPILATYMARRPPVFVVNDAGARHINVAHGIYPIEPLPGYALDRLAEELRRGVRLDQGRTYAGGLVKFEPREMERIPVPALDILLER